MLRTADQIGRQITQDRREFINDVLKFNEGSAVPLENIIHVFSVNLLQEAIYLLAKEAQRDPERVFKILYPTSSKEPYKRYKKNFFLMLTQDFKE